jgi:hypothetical protein
VTWPVVIPHDAPAGASFRFEIGPPGSAASWSEDLSAREIRRHLEAAGVVTLVVPAAAFSAGLQEARVVGVSAPEKPPTNLFVVEVLVVPAPR